MENLGEQVLIVIQEVAVKMGVAAEYVYPIMLRQARLEGIIGLILIFIPLIIFFSFIAIIWKIASKNCDEAMNGLMGCVLGLIISGGFFLATLFSIPRVLTALFNPDWYIFAELAVKLLK